MKNKIIVLVLISLLILLLDKANVLSPVKNIAEKIIVMPVSYVFSGAASTMDNNFRIVTFWKSGEERIKNLEQKNWELEDFRAKYVELLTENKILREQLNVYPAKTFQKVLAHVLENGETMILDAGENQKVKVGDIAVYRDFYVGRIVRTTANRSFVQLATSTNSSVNVKVGMVRGTADGQFNTSVVLDKISQDESIITDDLILTSGDGAVNIPNLILGKVGVLKSQQSDLFKKAQIVVPFEVKKLDTVFVILNEN